MKRTNIIVLVAALSVPAPWAVAGDGALFFSEYVEGSSNNKAVEIYSTSTVTVDLASISAQVRVYANGSITPTSTINLVGSINPGGTFVLAHSLAVFVASANQTSGALGFNGDDAVVLVVNDTIVDVIGRIGEDPGTEWESGGVSTLNQTLRRDASVCVGDADGSDPFDPAVEWLSFAIDTFDGLGAHTANCGASCPADITGDQQVNVADLLAVINGWGPCGDPCPADVNGDNQVNVSDLLGVINAWGACP